MKWNEKEKKKECGQHPPPCTWAIPTPHIFVSIRIPGQTLATLLQALFGQFVYTERGGEGGGDARGVFLGIERGRRGL